METYYHPHDLGKFAEMGKGNKDLWEKFMAYYSAVFAEGALTEREIGRAHV
jgi:4-carboxymuconolactone decarboxylase